MSDWLLEAASKIVDEYDDEEAHARIKVAIAMVSGRLTITAIEEEPVGDAFPVGTRQFIVTSEHPVEGQDIPHKHLYIVFVRDIRCIVLTAMSMQMISMQQLYDILING